MYNSLSQSIEGEVWRNIFSSNGVYQVSNYGRIKSNRKILRPHISNSGYYKISNIGYIHRLVAKAFIENHNNYPYVNHKDLNKLNNCIENLEWVTASENSKHFVRSGRSNIYSITSLANKAREIKIIQMDTSGRLVAEWDSIKKAALSLGLNNKNICSVVHGKRKSCGGFIWKKAI